MTFFNGIKVIETVEGVRPILEKSTAVIGLLATASAAVGQPTTDLNAAFPTTHAVLLTDVAGAIAKAGTGGTLRLALDAIADQGSPLVIVVRVPIATGDAEDPTQEELTIAAMQHLLAAQAVTGIRPRILGAPGLDSQDVVAALATVAQKLRGYIYAHCRDEDGELFATRDEAVTYRAEFSQREVELIWPDFTGWDGHAVAVALGLRAQLDETVGWHRSLSNVGVNGVTGISKVVTFDVRDQSTDAAVLNQAPITTLVRMNGYRFWGNRNCSDEPMYAFEPATRTAQAIQDMIADAETPFLGKPMTVGLVRDIVETANMRGANWQAQGRLIGFKCWYNPALNPVDQLSGGGLAIDYDFTVPAPLEGLTMNQHITGRYYLTFAQQLAS